MPRVCAPVLMLVLRAAARSSRRTRPTRLLKQLCVEAANIYGASRLRMGAGTAARTGC